MQFCRWIEKRPEPLTPQNSFRKTHGPLPFGPDEDPRVALPSRLAETPGLEERVRLVLGAIVQGADPLWVRSRLPSWGIHPVSIVLAESDSRNRAAFKSKLLPDEGGWTLGPSTGFHGSVLPQGLVIPGSLSLDGCAELMDLPEDLIAENLFISNCHELQSLKAFPQGVRGLRIENAAHLVELPEAIDLKNGFLLSACPRLETLPSVIHSGDMKISHCPGIRRITAKIKCKTMILESLINLTDLDLDLKVSGHLEINLPSLRTFHGKARIGGRLRLKGAALKELDADLTVGDHMSIRHCHALESIRGKVHVKGDLQIKLNPELTSTPEGFVGGTLELMDLPALQDIDPSLMTSCRTVRISRCAQLDQLPHGVHLRGSLELLDLPSMDQWPASMSVGILTAA